MFILEVSTMTSKDDNSCNVVVHVPKNKKFYCIIDKSKNFKNDQLIYLTKHDNIVLNPLKSSFQFALNLLKSS